MSQKFTVAGLTSPEKINAFQPGNATVNFYSDPGLRARALVTKFIVACVPLALIAVGVTWLFSQSWAFGLVMFGVMAVVIYDALSGHEERQSPEALERNRQQTALAAHRHEIDSQTEVARLQTQLGDMALKVKRLESRLLTQRALGDDKSNYIPANEGSPSPWPDDFEPGDIAAEIVEQVEDATKPDKALEILIDFVADLYKHPTECLLADGRTLDLKSLNGLPWSTRSGNPPAVINQMKAIIGGMPTRLLMEESGGRVWRLNVDAYPTLDDALKVLERA